MRVRSAILSVAGGAIAATVLATTLTAGAGDAGRSAPAATRCAGDEVALAVVGLTSDGRLVCFNEHRVSRARNIGTVTGLATDTRLVGVDFRPANGDLVGLGDKGGVYRIDPRSAAATVISRLNVALAGTSFGVDFNPTVDRLRIVSNTGQNLRANVDTGATTVDSPLAYVPPAGQTATPAQGVTAAAYTNNDADPNTATTLFDIDTALDQVVIQAAPNAGVLNPTGKLLADAGLEAGFDIYSHVRGGTTVFNRALAVLTVGGRSGVYRIDVLTGTARLLDVADGVVDVAIPLNQ